MAAAERELLRASALEQARLVRAREVSAEELTRLYLGRIARHDGALAAFVQVLGKSAVAQARRIDAMGPADRRAAGPFLGVPIGIKDLNFVRGAFTRMGSRSMRWLLSPVDDRVVAGIRRAGFVILGKLATSELGALPVTEPPTHAPTRNPWNPEVTAGGSSGGSGAAVAGGLLPIAQGSDGAGSIRIPSAFCHLFGIKPSRGLVPDAYGIDEPRHLAVCGPIARDVDDATALLEVMAGQALPRERPAPGLRVKVLLESRLTAVDPEIAAQVSRVARALEDLGHHVEPGAPLEASVEEFLPLWMRIIRRIPIPTRGALLGQVPQWLWRAGGKLRDEMVHARHDELAVRVAAWFGDADLWITPTVAVPPPRIGALARATPEATFAEAAVLGAFTAVFNISGQPAASLPVGLTAAGLPIGVQLAGRVGQDALVLAVARQLEEAMPWRDRRAPFGELG